MRYEYVPWPRLQTTFIAVVANTSEIRHSHNAHRTWIWTVDRRIACTKPKQQEKYQVVYHEKKPTTEKEQKKNSFFVWNSTVCRSCDVQRLMKIYASIIFIPYVALGKVRCRQRNFWWHKFQHFIGENPKHFWCRVGAREKATKIIIVNMFSWWRGLETIVVKSWRPYSSISIK